jgi:hypothetical protein
MVGGFLLGDIYYLDLILQGGLRYFSRWGEKKWVESIYKNTTDGYSCYESRALKILASAFVPLQEFLMLASCTIVFLINHVI